MPARVCVVGSSNTDMVIKTSRLPAPGETVLGGQFLMNPGGKGANQAVAAARLVDPTSPAVRFVARVGADVFGQQAIDGFRRDNLDVRYVSTDPEQPSGVALINVDERGENCISVAAGANGHLLPEHVDAALTDLEPGTILLMQLETPLDTVVQAARRGAERKLRVVLNPAPAQALPAELFAHLFLITPNETEASLLTNERVTDEVSAEAAARHLRQSGVQNVIVTLGAKGALVLTDEGVQIVETPRVTPVDTTAAGDCFNGALAVALAEGWPLVEAARFACRAAAVSVTRLGAQASMPTRSELAEIR